MFFFVDESGHTGKNLFDRSQPNLFYGVLHSTQDIDVVAASAVSQLRSSLNIKRLHASEMGLKKLSRIVPQLLDIQKEYGLTFDLYKICKEDHAVISFFDQVFDAALNPAVPWTGYSTPLRFMLLMKVAALFEEETKQDAWKARICLDTSTANKILLSVCSRLIDQVSILPDARSRELITDALTWAINNPLKILYNCSSKEEILNIAPNMIGFQFVMTGIARRITTPSGATRIIVDQQSEFNKSQRSLADVYSKMRQSSIRTGPGMPVMDFSNMPLTPIEFCAGDKSVGLELVDLYLYIFKQLFEEQKLPIEFEPLIKAQWNSGEFDQVSLKSIYERWMKFFNELPEPSDDQLKAAHQLVAEQEVTRKKAMRGD